VGLGALYTQTCHHVTTLAATSSRPNPETLAAHEVLALPHTTLHPCMCGLCGGATIVADALINYYGGARSLLGRRCGGDDCDRLLPLHQHASTLDQLLQLFFHCSTHLVVTIHDILVTSFLGWHNGSSASVVYPFPSRHHPLA
jgi:hypothetical protein